MPKKAYATLTEANDAIREMGKKWNLVYRKPYRCAICKAWHTTGTPPDGAVAFSASPRVEPANPHEILTDSLPVAALETGCSGI